MNFPAASLAVKLTLKPLRGKRVITSALPRLSDLSLFLHPFQGAWSCLLCHGYSEDSLGLELCWRLKVNQERVTIRYYYTEQGSISHDISKPQQKIFMNTQSTHKRCYDNQHRQVENSSAWLSPEYNIFNCFLSTFDCLSQQDMLSSVFQFSSVLPLFISYRSSGEKLIKYQANSSCVIMSVILMTTLFYKALILQGEI